jgi:hypothetical protein
MDIMELDEAQGLTAEMVRRYMTRTGWRPAESATYESWIHDTLKPSAGVFVLREKIDGAWSRITAEDLAIYVRDLASLEGRTVQSLLREINPRMRPGWPTDEEIERHAFWMVQTLSDDGIRVLGSYVAREWKKAGIKVECWPCDAHGNKVLRGKV